MVHVSREPLAIFSDIIGILCKKRIVLHSKDLCQQNLGFIATALAFLEGQVTVKD